jgi:hypothetical protein
MKIVLQAGNIWSGAGKGLAVLTNPTELAKRKGNLRNSYPVVFRGCEYADAEAAYQANKKRVSMGQKRIGLMAEIIECKLEQHPAIMQMITDSGGIKFIEACSHIVYGRSWWEGKGLASPFIMALSIAYEDLS